jgi:hypothetical protein
MTTNDLYYKRLIKMEEVRQWLRLGMVFGQSTSELTDIDGHVTLDGKQAGDHRIRK